MVEKADGLTRSAYLERVNIIRANDDSTFTHLDVNLGKAMDGDFEHNIKLSSNDQVTVYNYKNMKYEENVFISGHVLDPGEKIFLVICV